MNESNQPLSLRQALRLSPFSLICIHSHQLKASNWEVGQGIPLLNNNRPGIVWVSGSSPEFGVPHLPPRDFLIRDTPDNPDTPDACNADWEVYARSRLKNDFAFWQKCVPLVFAASLGKQAVSVHWLFGDSDSVFAYPNRNHWFRLKSWRFTYIFDSITEIDIDDVVVRQQIKSWLLGARDVADKCKPRPLGNPHFVYGGVGSLSSPPHLTSLITSYGGIDDNGDECSGLNPKFPPFSAILFALPGAVLLYYGLRNLKFGPQDWRGTLMLLSGVGGWGFGFWRFYLWIICH